MTTEAICHCEHVCVEIDYYARNLELQCEDYGEMLEECQDVLQDLDAAIRRLHDMFATPLNYTEAQREQ
jgi:hypothetical protein